MERQPGDCEECRGAVGWGGKRAAGPCPAWAGQPLTMVGRHPCRTIPSCTGASMAQGGKRPRRCEAGCAPGAHLDPLRLIRSAPLYFSLSRTHAHTRTHRHRHTHTRTHACAHTRTHTCAHVRTHTHTDTRPQAHPHPSSATGATRWPGTGCCPTSWRTTRRP